MIDAETGGYIGECRRRYTLFAPFRYDGGVIGESRADEFDGYDVGV
jgi:hypothetical protein